MIEIEYIVKDSRGMERLRTADRKAADAYDRILENAERLADWLRAGSVLPSLPDDDLETLTVHLARHAREVELILKGKHNHVHHRCGGHRISCARSRRLARWACARSRGVWDATSRASIAMSSCC